jgi:hypothetical protein
MTSSLSPSRIYTGQARSPMFERQTWRLVTERTKCSCVCLWPWQGNAAAASFADTRAHRRMSCCPSLLILCHPSRRFLSARRCLSFWWLRAIPPLGDPLPLPSSYRVRSVTQISPRCVYSAFCSAVLHLRFMFRAAKIWSNVRSFSVACRHGAFTSCIRLKSSSSFACRYHC